ncbi:MAG: exodeoxyribonuclease VII small subunit [Candidatus Omnitrophota bacterium]
MAESMKFEQALERLERIVKDLEGGNLPLEDAVKKYEQGVRLSLVCFKALDSAKRKIELLIKKDSAAGESKFETESFAGK